MSRPMSGRWASAVKSGETRYSSPRAPHAFEVRRSDLIVGMSRCWITARRSSMGRRSITRKILSRLPRLYSSDSGSMTLMLKGFQIRERRWAIIAFLISTAGSSFQSSCSELVIWLPHWINLSETGHEVWSWTSLGYWGIVRVVRNNEINRIEAEIVHTDSRHWDLAYISEVRVSFWHFERWNRELWCKTITLGRRNELTGE
jgi:hypothetical protein